MDRPVFLCSGGFEVSGTMLRTPRKTYLIGQIEYISVQRPLLLFAGLPALGVAAFTLGFWRYLEAPEIALLLGGSACAIALAACFGTLRVHSLALHDDEVSISYGPIGQLRAVRRAVEEALVWREEREGGA